jgi:hypothetical protein
VPPADAAGLARVAALNALAALGAVVDLDRVERIVKVVVFVASDPSFTGQPAVANGASGLLGDVFGVPHARSADRPEQAPGAREKPAAPPPAVVNEDDAGESEQEELTGIALFPPPGTDPIKRGLIVPEDFELPPGYVRHYQATDDGQRLPAILMFHPDYDWVDAQGNPVEIPADGVVPAELAPAGLPLQTLDVVEPDIPVIEEPGADEAGD